MDFTVASVLYLLNDTLITVSRCIINITLMELLIQIT